jgi:hypothetical protein
MLPSGPSGKRQYKIKPSGEIIAVETHHLLYHLFDQLSTTSLLENQ